VRRKTSCPFYEPAMRHLVSIMLVALGAVLFLAVSLAVRDRAMAAPPLSLDGYRDEEVPIGRDDSAGLKELNSGKNK